MKRVFLPLPLPSSATWVGNGICEMISPAYLCWEARVGRFWSGRREHPRQNQTTPVAAQFGSTFPLLDRTLRFTLPRNEKLRRHTGNAAGTNCGRSAATCRRQCAAIPLSSRSAFRRRNSQSNQDRTASVRTPAAAQTRCASIPSHFLLGHEFQMRSRRPGGTRRALDQNEQNRNCHVAVRVFLRPRGSCAARQSKALHRPRDEIVLPWAACDRAISRRRTLRRG